MKLRLIQPQKRYAPSYLKALHESLASSASPEQIREQINHLPEHLAWWRQRATDPKRVKRTHTFWLVDGTQYLGLAQVRLTPSGKDPGIRSHIYYEVRPSKRGKGLGSKLFRLTLNKARALGLRRILVSCDAANVPSIRIIEEAGGIFLKSVRSKGNHRTMRLYAFLATAFDRLAIYG